MNSLVPSTRSELRIYSFPPEIQGKISGTAVKDVAYSSYASSFATMPEMAVDLAYSSKRELGTSV